MVISRAFGGFLEFWSVWRVLAQNTGALAKFGNFRGFCVNFLGI
jgi:hypothetical protein